VPALGRERGEGHRASAAAFSRVAKLATRGGGLLRAADGYLEMIATIFLVRASTISTWPFTSA
jgi:hypothetical protein